MDGVCHSWAAVFGWRLEVGSWRLGGQQQEDGFQSPKKNLLLGPFFLKSYTIPKPKNPQKPKAKQNKKHTSINHTHNPPQPSPTHPPTQRKKQKTRLTYAAPCTLTSFRGFSPLPDQPCVGFRSLSQEIKRSQFGSYPVVVSLSRCLLSWFLVLVARPSSLERCEITQGTLGNALRRRRAPKKGSRDPSWLLAPSS
jgi:hypothetical protein